MPAMHLINVDLPAPLSPTRAITSPARTSKSTSLSACTEPKLLLIPRTASAGTTAVGAAGLVAVIPEERTGGDTSRRPRPRAVYLQYFAYVPLQTSPFFRNPLVKRSL